MSGTSGRRPAHTPTAGRQEIWEGIRAWSGLFTAIDIARATGANRKTVDDYLRCLVPGGVVEAIGDSQYRLVEDRGHHAPRLNRKGKPVMQGAGLENIWRSMRMLGQFTSQELALHSTTEHVAVSEATAKAYTSMLMRTGYLRVIQKAVPGKRKAVYRLIRNSGPRPPQIQRVKHVFDPNTRQVHIPGGEA